MQGVQTPQQQGQQAPSNAIGASVDPSSGFTNQTASLTNKLNGTQQTIVRFTADNAGGTAAQSKVFLLCGLGAIANETLPAGVTFSGDFASYGDFFRFFREVGVNITGMKMTTDQVSNWDGTLSLVNNTPNMKLAPPEVINFSDYREVVGGTYTNTLRINDDNGKLVATKILNATIDALNKNSYIQVTIYWNLYGQSASVTN